MTKPTMNVRDRIEANALIERICGDADSFDRADALRLIEIVPVTPKRLIDLSFGFRKSGGTTSGHAAGFGNVEMPNGDRSFDFDTRTIWRLGAYKVSHMPGRLEIRHVIGAADIFEEEEAKLIYRGSPPRFELRVRQTKNLTAFGVTIGFSRWPLWKIASDA